MKITEVELLVAGLVKCAAPKGAPKNPQYSLFGKWLGPKSIPDRLTEKEDLSNLPDNTPIYSFFGQNPGTRSLIDRLRDAPMAAPLGTRDIPAIKEIPQTPKK